MAQYPLPVFHFTVEWGGSRVGFSEVTGLTQENQAIEYRDGSFPEYSSIKMPGIRKFTNVVMKRGIEALRQRPQVIIGTIHNVKGGEADVVYLFPDLSRAADLEWFKGGEFRDSVIRQFYVGMTRAKQKLIICNPVGMYAVRGM